MRRHLRQTVLAVAAGLTLASGCAEEPAPAPIAIVADTPVAKPTAADEEPTVAKAVRSRPTTRQDNYQPPFPRRSELFFPPRAARRVTQKSGGRYEESVELIGVGSVGDPPHAILAIDGVTVPIAVGSEKEGVQVISVDAGGAVLQRGRNRWTATID